MGKMLKGELWPKTDPPTHCKKMEPCGAPDQMASIEEYSTKQPEIDPTARQRRHTHRLTSVYTRAAIQCELLHWLT